MDGEGLVNFFLSFGGSQRDQILQSLRLSIKSQPTRLKERHQQAEGKAVQPSVSVLYLCLNFSPFPLLLMSERTP